MNSVKKTISLASKIVEEAKKEINKEREENLKSQAKKLLIEINVAQRTVNLLEKQLKNFMRECDLD